MGMQKTSTAAAESRLNKSQSADLYLPPALRNLNQGNVTPITTTSNNSSRNGSGGNSLRAGETADIHSTAISIATNAAAVALNYASGMNATTTTTTCAIATTTSISCSNSPTHANEHRCHFNNTVTSTATALTTTSMATKSTTAQTTAAMAADSSAQQRQQQQQQHQTARRERRPDRAVYIPRARRSQTTPPITTTTATATTQPVTTAVSRNQQLAITVDASDAALVSAATLSSPDVITLASDTTNTTTTSVITASTAAEKKTKSISTRERKDLTTTNVHEKKSVNPVPVESIISNCDIAFEGRAALEHCEQQRNAQNRTTPHSVPTMASEKNVGSVTAVKGGMITNSAIVPHMLRIEDVAAAAEAAIACDRTPPKCDIDEQELKRAYREINRSNRRIIKQTFASDVLEIPEKIERYVASAIATDVKENCAKLAPPSSSPDQPRFIVNGNNTEEEEDDCTEDDDWETMFDESGECLDPKIMEELTASVGKVKIDFPQMDYSAYLTKQSILNDEEFPHVLEVSNFPVEFKNQDLLMVFSQYKESGFDIKWVDETHALAVFSSSRIAAEVLTMGHPFVVLKPLAEATVESRLKAKKCAASLQPYRPRPETCAALARRLVTGALGVRLKTAAAERENEKRVLREAKERKLLAAKQRDEVWES